MCRILHKPSWVTTDSTWRAASRSDGRRFSGRGGKRVGAEPGGGYRVVCHDSCPAPEDPILDRTGMRRSPSPYEAQRPRLVLGCRLSGRHAHRHGELPEPSLPWSDRYHRNAGYEVPRTRERSCNSRGYALGRAEARRHVTGSLREETRRAITQVYGRLD